MDVYEKLGERWGMSRDLAKARAFGAMYGVHRRDGKEVATQDQRDIAEVLKEHIVTDTISQSEHLKSLGSEKTEYLYAGPTAGLLETFPNPLPGFDGALIPGFSSTEIEIVAPEFTSLCPKTGQPDFATIRVNYQPDQLCVESKSFKLYLGSFRQAGEFHEACVARIARDLVALLKPKRLAIVGEFTPRGGISFWPKVEYYAGVDAEDIFG